MSALTPARDSSVLAVRRRSCIRPARDAAGRVEGFLAVVEATERARAVGAENMIATREHRHRRDDLLRRRLTMGSKRPCRSCICGRGCSSPAVVRQFTAAQARRLAAPRCRQQHEPQVAHRTVRRPARPPPHGPHSSSSAFARAPAPEWLMRRPPRPSGET